MKRYWVSWHEPTGVDLDWRPMVVPPKAIVPAYWCTGWLGVDGDIACVCAVVDAATEEQAKQTIKDYWKPWEVEPWRFIEERPRNWMPQEDRFPRAKEENDATLQAETT
jgi:hypothetical protein